MIFTRSRNAATVDNSMYCMIPDPFPSLASQTFSCAHALGGGEENVWSLPTAFRGHYHRGGGSKYALVRQNKTLVGDFVANLRTVYYYLIFYLTNIL